VAEREAQRELHRRQASLGEQVVQAGGLPVALPGACRLAERAPPPVLFRRRRAARGAAADQRARALACGLGDEVLVLALDRRVRDLEDVEDAHRDVFGQVREDAGHADEPDLALVLEFVQRLDGVVVRELLGARRHVHLHQVQAVGAQPAQALLNVGPDVAGAVVVRVRRRGADRDLQQAAALRSEEVLLAAAAEVAADKFLAPAVVRGSVDEVDAAVEHRVQQAARVLVIDLGSPGLSAQFHRPVAEDGDVRASPAEGSGFDRHGVTLSQPQRASG
jgi:hypothetical protein